MKRRIVAAMLAGVMALGMLAGCGGSGKSDSDGGRCAYRGKRSIHCD